VPGQPARAGRGPGHPRRHSIHPAKDLSFIDTHRGTLTPTPDIPPAAPATLTTVTTHVAAFAELDTATLYAILRLRADVFVVEQACAYPDIDGRDLEPLTRHVWIGDDGGPIAYLRILDDGAEARIGRVCVHPAHRGAGHAGTLMAAALEIIGSRPAVLDAQTYATSVYERAGFVIDGPEYLEDGIPHMPMRRPAV
jgi:ElaA protein